LFFSLPARGSLRQPFLLSSNAPPNKNVLSFGVVEKLLSMGRSLGKIVFTVNAGGCLLKRELLDACGTPSIQGLV
jgi:hypothetical protein